MIVLYLIHPTLFLESLSIYRCDKILGINKELLHVDYKINCGTNNYLFFWYLSSFFIIVYIMGSIVLVVGRLYHNAKSKKLFIRNSYANKKYSFFIKGFREETYYWEFILILRKLCIVMFAATVNSSLQLTYAIIIITTSIYINILYKPYKSNLVNKLETFTLIALYLTLIFGSHFLFTANEYVHTMSTILIFFVNIITSIVLIYILVFKITPHFLNG
jgi:hypothetical protein